MIAVQQPHVLVIDDDTQMLDAVQSSLAGNGYGVAAVSSGAEAFDEIAAHRPDVILLDLRMPGMDGWEVLNRVRALGLDIPVVLMTADTRARDDAERLGMAGFLAKPFAFDDLLATVGRVAPTG